MSARARFTYCSIGLVCFWNICSSAHVGSPTVFFDGKAGDYPVHVVIHPAEVIPGLAEINVRVEADGIQRVTALPMKWNMGRQGAPPPDVAKPVGGDPHLFSAELWFMEAGAQSVELEVTGATGTGRVTIPVDAVARRVLTMPKALGGVLAFFGVALIALFLSIIAASVRESVLDPGLEPSPRRRRWARVAAIAVAIVLALLLWGGKHWWGAEAADYRNNRLYRPITAVAHVRVENGQRVLRLEIDDPAFARWPPMVPDHGKLMHLFLTREPALDVFAHLHPVKRDRRTFESVLPDLPPGRYRIFADATYETGLSDTITATVDIPEAVLPGEAAQASALLDSDNSWWIGSTLVAGTPNLRSHLGTNYDMYLRIPARIVPNDPLSLHVEVRDAGGHAVATEPYLGMRGHLSLCRDDGSVFTHLHPGGTASMAAMQLSVLRTEGKLPFTAAFGSEEPICQLPEASPRDQQWVNGAEKSDGVSFPYAFPKPGWYRLWVQVKIHGEILTGAFDVEVKGGDRSDNSAGV